MKKIGLVVLIIVFLGVVFQLWSLSGFEGNLFRLFVRDDAFYSNKYDERTFRMVEKGLSVREVLKRLGPPLRILKISGDNETIIVNLPEFKTDNAIYCLEYSLSSSDQSYSRRAIFVRNGTVVKTIREFYLD